MFANKEQAENYVSEKHHDKLSELKNGLTYILKASELTNELIGYKTIGVRIVPEFETLIQKTGPLFTTSANIHGEETKEFYEDIFDEFNNKVGFIKKGIQKSKNPSTIISFIDGVKEIR
jgi:tRNA A37 threonylcarbamoyladenosine synthetase subunit TsaC/SUA5/YrdC